MFNLIRKDIILQKRLLILYIGILLFYIWADFGIVFTVMMVSSLFVMNSHYYDEKDKANILLNSLPYSRKQIVSSKYIGALFSTVVTIVAFMIAYLIMNSSMLSITLEQILLCFLGTMAFTSLYLPFFYKFTQQYLLMIFAIFVMIIVILARQFEKIIVSNFAGIIESVQNMASAPFYSILIALVIVAFTFSWLLSIKIYRNKAF